MMDDDDEVAMKLKEVATTVSAVVVVMTQFILALTQVRFLG